MAGYVVVDVDVTDQATYDEYRKHVLATITKHGGKFLVRGGAFEKIEGDWPWHRVVVLEFPSVAAAKTWYNSPDYQPLAKMRLKASRSNLIIVEGA